MATTSQGIRSCDSCKHCIHDFQSGQKECRRYPPKMQVFLVPQGPTRHGFLEYSGYPKVDVMKPCGEHVFRPALGTEEPAQPLTNGGEHMEHNDGEEERSEAG